MCITVALPKYVTEVEQHLPFRLLEVHCREAQIFSLVGWLPGTDFHICAWGFPDGDTSTYVSLHIH